ncbi:TPA: hypothetical protein SMF55_003704 [Serratia liquefaciens]|nr:hypothetical protein [Serratia liquefaciens]
MRYARSIVSVTAQSTERPPAPLPAPKEYLAADGIIRQLKPLPPPRTTPLQQHLLPSHASDSVDCPVTPQISADVESVFTAHTLVNFERHFKQRAIDDLFSVLSTNKQDKLHNVFNNSRNSAARLNIIDFALLYSQLAKEGDKIALDKVAKKYVAEILKDKLGAGSAFSAWTDRNNARSHTLEKLGNKLCDFVAKKHGSDALELGSLLKATDVKLHILADIENQIKEPLNANAINQWEGIIDRAAKDVFDTQRQNVADLIALSGPGVGLYARDLKLVAKLPELLRPIWAEIIASGTATAADGDTTDFGAPRGNAENNVPVMRFDSVTDRGESNSVLRPHRISRQAGQGGNKDAATQTGERFDGSDTTDFSAPRGNAKNDVPVMRFDSVTDRGESDSVLRPHSISRQAGQGGHKDAATQTGERFDGSDTTDFGAPRGNAENDVPVMRFDSVTDRRESDSVLRPHSISRQAGQGGNKDAATQTGERFDGGDTTDFGAPRGNAENDVPVMRFDSVTDRRESDSVLRPHSISHPAGQGGNKDAVTQTGERFDGGDTTDFGAPRGNAENDVPVMRFDSMTDRREPDSVLRPHRISHPAGKAANKETASQAVERFESRDDSGPRDLIRFDRLKSKAPSVERFVSVTDGPAVRKVEDPLGYYADLKFQNKKMPLLSESYLKGLRNSPGDKPAELLLEGIRQALAPEINQQTMSYYSVFNDFRERLLPSNEIRRKGVLADATTAEKDPKLLQDMNMLQYVLASHPDLKTNRENIRSFVNRLIRETNLLRSSKENPLVVAILDGVLGVGGWDQNPFVRRPIESHQRNPGVENAK